MQYTLKNNQIAVTISDAGAEIVSVIKDGAQYIWHGDPAFWGRHAPVLFPIVGSLKDKTFIHQGKSYMMNQHGFARDTVFSLVSQTEDTLWFEMTSSPETVEKYPFEFKLAVGYTLTGTTVKVMWKVTNTGSETMYFSIGAHPAFSCPLHSDEKQSDYYLDFHTDHDLTTSVIGEGGLIAAYDQPVCLDHGLLPIHDHLFDNDALIIEHHQTQKVSLLTPDKKPYVTVTFDAPLFGVWSPVGKHAPFVCIEPWYGRCDAHDFNGELKDRVYGNTLETGCSFDADYTIEFN